MLVYGVAAVVVAFVGVADAVVLWWRSGYGLVVGVHGVADAAGGKVEYGIAADGSYFFDDGLFVVGEFSEDEGGEGAWGRLLGSDADAEPCEFVAAEAFDDVFESVLAAGGSFGADPDGADGNVEVVGEYEEVVAADFVEVHGGDDGVTGVVHVSHRFDDDNGFSAVGEAGGVEVAFAFGEGYALAGSELIDCMEADVVPGAVVAEFGIAESDDQFHGVRGCLLGCFAGWCR